MATPVKWGTEFLVNTTTADFQYQPTLTGLANGRFVVAWTDLSQTAGDTSATAIRAQVFNADGTLAGAEFVVNTTTLSNQFDPTITALADGRFVVAWTDQSATGVDTDGWAVKAQVFNADGSASGSEFLVNSTTTSFQYEPTITGLANGRFVVAWRDDSTTGGDTSLSAIRAQVFNADGSTFGAEFLANTTTTNSQSQPTITALANGRFVVAWTDLSQTGGDTSQYAIRAQVFNADGSTLGAEFLVNTTTALGQINPTVTGLANGRFVVAWVTSQTGADNSDTTIRAQVFNANGSTFGAEFEVNTTIIGGQSEPTITALADGRFVLAWTDDSVTGGDTSFSAIRAQLFNADGSTSGAEFLVNTTTANSQLEPTITGLADGRFVVSWFDASATGGDPTDGAIRAQIFDPREAAVLLGGTALNDDYVGTRFGDTMSGGFGNDALVGAAGNDILSGGQGNDTQFGGQGNDTLFGGTGIDRLSGGGGNDWLIGGTGADRMAGGAGADTFVFASATEAGTAATHDRISDFTPGSDRLDLAAIQAGQTFIGAAGFGNVAGQVRYDVASGLLSGDLNGDGVADYVIELTNLAAITAADLIL